MLIVSKPGKWHYNLGKSIWTITLDISKDNQLNTPKVLDGNEVKLVGSKNVENKATKAKGIKCHHSYYLYQEKSVCFFND